ncbi:MAG: ABC transporter, fused permease protein [uncultured Solirubrobacteraceae bacterium]|uniref:ABC transporter, fused permease protein n=1 Tax=uncultured Solirubrobacteraceae bacterium TaxID=1162706 RepID=A0A6J4TPH1_9ACTN|nr:MAG: ABC transporter, fused permease protein [uncultured Solirubrobacteraceae bacterium]
MTRLTLRSLATRKLRTALTAMAVVLGVAMISGTYVLTDTIDRAFGGIFQEAAQGVDVAVTPQETFGEADEQALDAALLERVRRTPGVQEVSGEVFAQVRVNGKDGKPISTQGPPTFADSVGPERFEPFKAVEGRMPTADDEVALDRDTFEDEDFALGDTITVTGDPGSRRYELVGVARFGAQNSIAGATVALLTLREAQEMTDRAGQFDQLSAAADSGVSPEELRARVGSALRGEKVNVRTGKENADAETSDTQEEFGFLQTALLVFAGIALFVGAFVIYNTFSITIAQRLKELALLRTLGASRRQVLSSVILEALLVGTVAALLGLAGGLLVAPGIVALFSAIGVELPDGNTVVATRTIVVSLIVGIGVTLVASVVPAVRATRVPPMAAMREGVGLPRRSGKGRLIVAGLLTLAGAVALGAGLFAEGSGESTASLLGLGAALIFLGTALLSPQLVRPLARLVGAPFERLFGITGRLARENAMRNPGRTASTAAALMIGLTLVTFVSIFAAGFRGSIDRVVDRQFAGDLTVRNDDGFSPLPLTTKRSLADLPEVASASGVRFATSKVRGVGGETVTIGVDPETLASGYRVKFAAGSDDAALRRLGPDEVFVDRNWAVDNEVSVGDRLRVLTTSGERPVMRVVGELDEGGSGLLGGGILVSNAALEQSWDERRDAFIFLDWRSGIDVASARTKLDRLLETKFPGAESQDREEVKEAQAGMINQLLGLLYALLMLSVIVSLFGIVNTLALSIHERTRELGMLRAIGTSKRQVRRTIRLESAITALIGAVLGLGLGIAFAAIVSRPLEADGFVLTLPWGTLAVLLVLAAVAGVLAAIGPARRAAKTDILHALAYE